MPKMLQELKTINTNDLLIISKELKTMHDSGKNLPENALVKKLYKKYSETLNELNLSFSFLEDRLKEAIMNRFIEQEEENKQKEELKIIANELTHYVCGVFVNIRTTCYEYKHLGAAKRDNCVKRILNTSDEVHNLWEIINNLHKFSKADQGNHKLILDRINYYFNTTVLKNDEPNPKDVILVKIYELLKKAKEIISVSKTV